MRDGLAIDILPSKSGVNWLGAEHLPTRCPSYCSGDSSNITMVWKGKHASIPDNLKSVEIAS